MNKTIGKAVVITEVVIILCLSILHCGTTKIVESFQKIKTVDVQVQKNSEVSMIEAAVSKPRIMEEELVIREKCYELSDEEYNNLLRIVEAEATGEGMEGKMLVANVVLNRVKSEKFPDTVTEVIYQNTDGKVQFSPVADGRLDKVRITDETVEAVERVLYGEDESEGALYFVASKKADPTKYNWFKTKLRYLFTYGGHEFYK